MTALGSPSEHAGAPEFRSGGLYLLDETATIAINGTTQTFPPAIPTDKQAILDALNRPNVTH